MSTLSIIVTVGPQIKGFKAFLSRLWQTVSALNGCEIIVVDGSASAAVATICRSSGVCFVRAGKGRLTQMARGAELAHGDYLLFIGADTTLPANFADVWRMVRRAGPVWGFFALRFRQAPLRVRWLARMVSLRSRVLGIAVEEQPLFVQRNAWRLAGDSLDGSWGEDPMDYAHLCRRLRVITPPCVMRQAVDSESIRWQQMSWWQTIIASVWLRLPDEVMPIDAGVSISPKPAGGRKRTPELP